MQEVVSFGSWIRQRRKALDLTQDALARRVGCAAITLQKIEREERRPSREIAERLADGLELALEERVAFVKVARAELATGWLAAGTAREAQPMPAATRGSRPAPATTAVNGEDVPAPGEAPFKGLSAFEEADAAHFFGREALTAMLAGHLREQRFLAVVGASGSGKSSLVRAGLVPALRGGEPMADGTFPPPGSTSWPVHIITPTTHPLESLALSLTRDAHAATATTTLLDDLARDERILHIVARKLLSQAGLHQAPGEGNGTAGDARLLLVVDQFEEVFTLCRSEAERRAFVDNLLFATAPESGGATSVVITLRADFYAHCAQYTGLREALAARQAYIGPMSGAELRRAIEEPARRDGWELEPGLVDLLLRDVGDEPGALPLLSHALLETWKRRRGRRLTLAGYAKAGGVREAIARTAERVYEELPPEQQAVARWIFLRLTELGEGTQDTRRRAALNELIPISAGGTAVADVLRRLADARLITLADESAEVAHEALIREWPMLREWLLEDREGLRLHRRVTEAAHDWDRLEQDPGALYRGARLTQAGEWASTHPDELTGLEREFLEASQEQVRQEEAEREARRRRELDAARQRADEQARAAQQLRRLARSLAGTALIAAVLAVAALLVGRQASQNADLAVAAQATAEAERGRAEESARVARSHEWAAVASNSLETDPERGILLALQAISVTQTREAEEALRRALLASRIQLTLSGHTDAVTAVDVSADGTRLATASQDRTIRVWEAGTGRLLHTLTASDPQRTVAFSPDGKRVASGGEYGTARVWDAETGRDLLKLYPGSNVRHLAWSKNGKFLAVGTRTGTTVLWDAASGDKLDTFPGSRPVRSIAFSAGDTRLIKVAEGGAITAWDLAAPDARGQLLNPLLDPLLAGSAGDDVALSPDGTRLAITSGTGTVTGTVAIWDVATGSRQLLLRSSGSGQIPRSDSFTSYQIYRVTFSPDGQRVATTSLDGAVNVWDASTGEALLTLAGHQGAVLDVRFSPDGRRLVTASADQTAKVWNLGPTAEALAVAVPDGSGRIALSADGTRLATGSLGGTVKVWDAQSGTQLLTLSGHQGAIRDVHFNGDGTRLATASDDRTVRVWDTANGHELYTLRGYITPVFSVAFSPDGTRLITGGDTDKSLAKVWDVNSGRPLRTVYDNWPGRVNAVAFSPDGERFALSSEDQTVHLLDTTGKKVGVIRGHTSPVLDAAWSPDGSRLATAGSDWTVKVWDIGTDKELLALSGHINSVAAVVFSRDGTQIATAGRDGMAKVWDATTGDLLRTLSADGRPLSSVAFSPDGTRLVTSSDNAVRVYLLRLEEVVAAARTRVTRSLTADECRQFLRLDQCPAMP